MPRPDIPNFLQDLEEILTEEDKGRGVREFRHNPSSATFKYADGKVTGACLRQLWYVATNTPQSDTKEFTSKLQALFGEAIHTTLLEKWAKSSKFRVAAEDKGRIIIDPLTRQISFRLDGLVNYRGDQGGLEIKTKQGYGLQRMAKTGGPSDADLLQVLTYFGTNPEIKWFTLVYVARDSGYRAEYHIYPNDDGTGHVIEGVTPKAGPRPIKELSFEGVKARWKDLEEFVDSGTEPPRDYKAVLDKEGRVTEKRSKNYVEYKTAFQCNYCRWQTHCWSQPDAKDFAVKLPE